MLGLILDRVIGLNWHHGEMDQRDSARLAGNISTIATP